jgi:hypothetical protein
MLFLHLPPPNMPRWYILLLPLDLPTQLSACQTFSDYSV